MAIVSAKEFTYTYPGAEQPALKKVSLEVERGDVVGLIGSVGAGKTTLCMAMAQVAPRILGGEADGQLTVLDREEHEGSDAEHRHRLGMVFEDYAAQLTQLKVIEEVMAPLCNLGSAPPDAERRAHELLKKVGLGSKDVADKWVWDLSGGQQQRLAIAAVLALDPEVVILDSVMDKLDPYGQEQVRDIIASLSSEKTLVVVEQKLDLLVEAVDRLLVLKDGEVIAQGTPAEILRNDEWFDRADVEPPVSLRVARALGLAEAPLTPEEFERIVDSATPREETLHPEQSSESRPHADQPRAEKHRTKPPDDHRPDAAPPHQGQPIQWLGTRQPPTGSDRPAQPLVCIEQVRYRYPDGTQALEDVSLAIRAGEVHALIGGSGAGKTTLLKQVVGLLKPAAGQVTVRGEEVRKKRVAEWALTVGTVLQNPDEQISERTVRAEIAFPLKQRQYEKKGLFGKRPRYDDHHIEQQVARVCQLVGIKEALLDHDPILLPRGQRKLVTIAAALAVDPAVLLLDEPTAGLGATSRQHIRELIAQLRESGKAVLIADNDVDFIAEVADTMTVLEQGHAALQGPVSEVFAADNWDRLARLHFYPPQAARLARHLGVTALTCGELIARLSSNKTSAGSATSAPERSVPKASVYDTTERSA